MSHGCFISYKKKDKDYLKMIDDRLAELGIVHSFLDTTIPSDNIDTVIGILRHNYMNNKPVTLFLIGEYSYEDTKERLERLHGKYCPHDEYNEQSFIIRELRATLSDYEGSPRHGVVGIVLPEMEEKVYGGTWTCPHCGKECNVVRINDDTVIREFSENYYMTNKDKNGCDHYSAKERYCILCTLKEFLDNPDDYINQAYEKSTSSLADNVRYKNIKHDYKLRDN